METSQALREHLEHRIDALIEFVALRVRNGEYPPGECEHLAELLDEIERTRRSLAADERRR